MALDRFIRDTLYTSKLETPIAPPGAMGVIKHSTKLDKNIDIASCDNSGREYDPTETT